MISLLLQRDLRYCSSLIPMKKLMSPMKLLRSVMGATGERVGWIIAGQDNLWAGLSQRLRSQETVYGYKNIVRIVEDCP